MLSWVMTVTVFQVDILLPGCDELPSDLERVLTEQPVFLAQQVPLAKLVTEEFRCCFVKRGRENSTRFWITCHQALRIIPEYRI